MPYPVLKVMNGPTVTPYLDQMQTLRASIYREYPYLLSEESLAPLTPSLAQIANNTRSLFVLAFEGVQLVGLATGMPMNHESKELQDALDDAGYTPNRVFFLRESILGKAYRGQGVGRQFVQEREAHARRIGANYCCFRTVRRKSDDPRKPANYQPETIWKRWGYRLHPQVKSSASWRDLDEGESTTKAFAYWFKKL